MPPIEWNIQIPPETVADSEEARQKALLERELAMLGVAKAPLPTPQQEPDSQKSVAESPPAPPEPEPAAPSKDDESIAHERVYTIHAKADQLVTRIAEDLLKLLQRAPHPDVASCAIGRALTVYGSADLVLAAYSIDEAYAYRRGDRVTEENGSLGTVVSVQSLTRVIVKWDHERKPMVTDIAHITRVEDEADGG